MAAIGFFAYSTNMSYSRYYVSIFDDTKVTYHTIWDNICHPNDLLAGIFFDLAILLVILTIAIPIIAPAWKSFIDPILKESAKEKISAGGYQSIYNINCLMDLRVKCREEYLDVFQGSSDYRQLKKYFDSYDLALNAYASAMLTQRIHTAVPLSPISSAIIGNAIAGPAAGVAAAYTSVQKQKAYQENENIIAKQQREISARSSSVEVLYAEIEKIIMTNPKTAESWTKHMEQICSDMNNRYRVK